MGTGRNARTEPAVGSGDVFVDLGIEQTEEDIAKIKLAQAISQAIEKMEITQVEAAARIGVDQARISDVLRGRLKDFSIDRLFRYLRLLGNEIDIQISSCRPRRHSVACPLGRISVRAV